MAVTKKRVRPNRPTRDVNKWCQNCDHAETVVHNITSKLVLTHAIYYYCSAFGDLPWAAAYDAIEQRMQFVNDTPAYAIGKVLVRPWFSCSMWTPEGAAPTSARLDS